HIEVAQCMHGQYRHIEIAMDFRQPAHPVTTARIHPGNGGDTWQLPVELQFLGRRLSISPAIDAAPVVVKITIQHAADSAIVPTAGHHGILVIRAETVLKYRTLTTSQAHGHLHQTFTVDVGWFPGGLPLI